jgi:outer membrane protein assembly factor BamA
MNPGEKNKIIRPDIPVWEGEGLQKVNKRLGTMFFFCLFLVFEAGAESPAIWNGIIRKIVIQGNRVQERVIRKELTFKEGDRLTEEAIKTLKENLLKLGIFKKLEIEPVWDDALDGIKITITAQDGWYLLPWPLLGSRGGNLFAALMITEKNLLKWGEGISFWGFYDQENWSIMSSFYLPKIYMVGGVMETDRLEYLYADGAYNSKKFDSRWSWEKAEDFGQIADSYGKNNRWFFAGAGIPPLRDWKLYLGFNSTKVRYRDRQQSPEKDSGQFNSMVCSIGYGKAVRMLGGYDSGAGGIGRIFGLGLAGLEESLKPISKKETNWGGLLTIERGDDLLGSEVDFTKVTGQVKYNVLFRDRSLLEIALNGGIGVDLPESKRFATNRLNGLKGFYAREYRGESLTVLTAEYSHPLFRNEVGGLIGKGFLDLALCRQDRKEWGRQGLGLEVSYRFWRFPLPLGLGVTYSFDDRNWQYSAAMGGFF